MLGAYRSLFDVPRVRPLILSSLLARVAIAAIGLPIVFIAKDASDSFAVAGIALGAYWVGVALAAPFRGRWIDRRGPRATIPALSIGTFLALVLMPPVASVSAWLLVPLGLVGGAAMPPFFAVARAVWRRLLGADDARRERAYAFEASAQDGVYLLGPMLAGLGIATIGPDATLIVAATAMLPAGLAYARLAPSGPSEGAGAGGPGPIRVRGVQVLLAGVLLTSLAFGTLEVGVPAFTDERGAPGAAGLLLGLFAGGGMLGGLAFGARSWTRSTPVGRFVVVSGLSVLAYAVLPLAGSVVVLGAMLFFVGMPFTAGFVALSSVLDALVPPGSDTEAMTWMTLGNGVGVAGGSAIGGSIVEAAGTDAAFLAATGMTLLGFLAVLAGHRSLRR